MKARWTDKEIEKLFALRKEGKTFVEIAPILGRTKKACEAKYVNVAQQRAGKTEETDAMIRRIKELISLGYDEQEIADDLYIAKHRVYQLKKMYGVKLTSLDLVRIARRKAEIGKPKRNNTHSKDSLCWNCCRAMRGCKKPVKGFKAKKVEWGHFEPKRYSYIVRECPNFKPDPWLKEERK